MSAFLLPLLYLTSGRGGACDYLDCFVAAHYFCRGTCEGLRLGHPRWLYPQKNTFSKKFEYISGKSITEVVSLPRKCFFTGNIRLSDPQQTACFTSLHNISCITVLSAYCTTTSTLPKRYRPC